MSHGGGAEVNGNWVLKQNGPVALMCPVFKGQVTQQPLPSFATLAETSLAVAWTPGQGRRRHLDGNVRSGVGSPQWGVGVAIVQLCATQDS